jgi:ATP-binding cassette, subfamily C, bacterial CydC
MVGRPVLRLLALARPAWARLALSVVAGIGSAGAGIALMATSAWLISRAAQHPPVLYLMVAIVAVRTFGLSRGLLRYVERLVGHDAALRVLGELRARSYSRLTRLVPAAAADLPRGDLVARFVADIDSALDVLIRAVLPYSVSLLVAAGSVGYMVSVLPAAGIALAAGAALVTMGLPVLHLALSQRADRRLAPLRGQLHTQTVALLTQLPDIVAYQADTDRRAELARTDAALRRASTGAGLAVAATTGVTAAATGACSVLALILGAAAVRSHHLDPVLLAVVVLTPLAVFDALAGLPAAASALRTGRAALARVFEILDRDDPVPDPVVAIAAPVAPYDLRLSHVTAGWTPAGPPVLSDVDIDFPAGSRTLIVGPSGSGKTTLAALLVRFLDPTAGAVTVNGTDLRHLTGEQVRGIVGLVDDQAYLFDATIAANLRVGAPDATDHELHTALTAARLDAWVRQLPAGLATRVGEHGARLSGGQRRRLAYARALLSHRPVLVLDEPTEHLDEATATELVENMLAAAGDRTVIVITHRPNPAGVDQIIRLTNGQVASIDRPSSQRQRAG